MKDPLRTLRNEHGSIAAVLHGLQYLARDLRKPDVKPQLAVFRAMIHYIDAFPERFHHPKEDEWLFARLLQRAPQAGALVQQLKQEHVDGARFIRELEAALDRYEREGPAGAIEFADAVERFAEFHWNHMRKEEQQVLPLARKHLTDADFEEIERAFESHGDPIADLRERDFDALFARIVSIAPAPIGLGEPWKRPHR